MYLLQNTVYWIHDSDETNHLTEGYVGITNNFERRMGEHGSTYGKVKEVLFEGLSRTEAENKEKELRPTWHIGKNIAPGGQAGNRPKGIHTSGWTHSEESKAKRSEILKGNTNGRYRAEETVVEGITFRSVYEACEYLSNKYGYGTATAADRIKNNKPFDFVYKPGGAQNKKKCVVENLSFETKKDAVEYIMSKYDCPKHKALSYIDGDITVEGLARQRKKHKKRRA